MLRTSGLRVGAVLLVAAGVEVLLTVVAAGSFGELSVTLASTSTPLAVLIGSVLVACGVSVWAQPASRVLAGIVGMACALAALPGANLGGALLGTVLGVVGSAAVLAWSEDETPGSDDSDVDAPQRDEVLR